MFQLAAKYASVVNPLIAEASVVDIGCGDYRVGRLLECASYLGVDIVPEVIRDNQKKHARPGFQFMCGDAATMDLPEGDVFLVRQVLQHLSYADITTVLNRLLSTYPVVITSDQVWGKGNDDLVTGKDIRRNGLYLELPPLNYHVNTIGWVRGTPELLPQCSVRITRTDR